MVSHIHNSKAKQVLNKSHLSSTGEMYITNTTTHNQR